MLPPFKFNEIKEDDVKKALKQLKVCKSTGLDGIPARVLKIANDVISPSLTYIFNL